MCDQFSNLVLRVSSMPTPLQKTLRHYRRYTSVKRTATCIGWCVHRQLTIIGTKAKCSLSQKHLNRHEGNSRRQSFWTPMISKSGKSLSIPIADQTAPGCTGSWKTNWRPTLQKLSILQQLNFIRGKMITRKRLNYSMPF